MVENFATIFQVLNETNNPKNMVLFEEKIVENLSSLSPKEEEKYKAVDKLAFKTFLEKFNTKYGSSLLKEQKELLGNFITSYSDNGLGLKVYLNNEIGRLKEAVSTEIVGSTNEALTENFQKVKAKLDSYAKTPLNEAVVEEIFYIQDLLAEVKRNVS